MKKKQSVSFWAGAIMAGQHRSYMYHFGFLDAADPEKMVH